MVEKDDYERLQQAAAQRGQTQREYDILKEDVTQFFTDNKLIQHAYLSRICSL